MKSAENNSILVSRHTPGAASCTGEAGNGPAQAIHTMHFLRFAAGRVVSALDFFVREALPLALPSDGFQPESNTLCSAHWNRIYLIRGAKL